MGDGTWQCAMLCSTGWEGPQGTQPEALIVEWRWLEGASGGHLAQQPPAQARPPADIAQDRVQAAFQCLEGGRLHSFSGQPVPVLGHPRSEKLFLFHTVFQCVPNAFSPVTEHGWKEPGSIQFALSLQVFVYVDEIPPIAAKLTQLTDILALRTL